MKYELKGTLIRFPFLIMPVLGKALMAFLDDEKVKEILENIPLKNTRTIQFSHGGPYPAWSGKVSQSD